MSFTRRQFVTTGSLALGGSCLLLNPQTAFAQLVTPGVFRVSPSNDLTGQADRIAIQAAISSLEGAGGGVVELTAGNYYLDQRLTIRNRLVIRGNNGRTTEVRPGSAFADTYLFEFHNRQWNSVTGVWDSVSQFNCRLEEMSIRCVSNSGVLAAVWARSWNEQCGLRNVLIWEFNKHAVLFTDAFGGTATFQISECEFMAAAAGSASYPALFFTTPNSVGYTNAILEHVVAVGPVSHAGYGCVEARNGMNVVVVGGHVEQCDYGIYMSNRSNLTLNGFTGSPTSVVNLIGCAGDFTGKVFGSGVLLAGATGHVLRDNKNGNHISVEQNPLVFP